MDVGHIEEKGNKYGQHGGFLCDEMGLGKTVTTIALMLSDLFPVNIRKTPIFF